MNQEKAVITLWDYLQSAYRVSGSILITKTIIILVLIMLPPILYSIPYGTYWMQDLPDAKTNLGTAQFSAQKDLSLGQYLFAKLSGKRVKEVSHPSTE